MRSVKDIDSTTFSNWLCSFAHVMKEVANTSKEYEKDERGPEGFQSLLVYSNLSTILYRNLEADLGLSC